MVWDDQEGVRPWLTSDHPASDWMMSPTDSNTIFLIERYHDPSRQRHRARLLKATPAGETKILWPWFDDTHRFGEGGFVVLPDGSVLFARYPHLFMMYEGQKPEIWPGWAKEVTRIKRAGADQLLIQSENDIWLASLSGYVEKHWTNLLEERNGNFPFMGNRIFDAAYDASELWLAYWGKRRFDVVGMNGRKTIFEFNPPFLPHAVAAGSQKAFCLASSLDPGNDIHPQLWMLDKQGLQLIWGEPE